MDAALLTPSKYIKAIGFKGKDRTITITGVTLQEMEREDRTKETKGLISVAETPKQWILNVTNCKCLIAMFGRETDKWLGKKVTLYPAPNEMSESGVAIRVRGSPELEKDITFTLKLARKKPKSLTLKATGKNGHAAAAEPVSDDESEDEPAHDPDTGEVTDAKPEQSGEAA
jgi:hypothetical protein